jgi:hypothetical protein
LLKEDEAGTGTGNETLQQRIGRRMRELISAKMMQSLEPEEKKGQETEELIALKAK